MELFYMFGCNSFLDPFVQQNLTLFIHVMFGNKIISYLENKIKNYELYVVLFEL